MTHNATAIEDLVSQQELATFAAVKGRCITATVNIPVPAQIRPRLNHAVRELERQIKETDIDRPTSDLLLAPLRDLTTTIETEGDWAVSLALYRSPDIFRSFHLPEQGKDEITIADHFRLRPLLGVLSREQKFYVLALSRKNVRLFECANHRIREISLEGYAPRSLEVFMNTKAPDHVLDNRSSGGPDIGSMKGVSFGTNTDREKHNEYLAHFFREIDKGMHRLLNSGTSRVLFAGVQEEVALYRRVNTYKHLLEQDIHGSPDGLSPVELHRRALETVRKQLAAPVARVVREFENHAGAKRASVDLDAILKAANEGRVSDLFLREDADRRGEDGEDLLESAARATLTHGGQAFALRAAEMPNNADVAAVFRF